MRLRCYGCTSCVPLRLSLVLSGFVKLHLMHQPGIDLNNLQWRLQSSAARKGGSQVCEALATKHSCTGSCNILVAQLQVLQSSVLCCHKSLPTQSHCSSTSAAHCDIRHALPVSINVDGRRTGTYHQHQLLLCVWLSQYGLPTNPWAL